MPTIPYRDYLLSEPWRLLRAAVLRRCFSICERCGKHKPTEVHHLTYARLGAERMEDLLALCSRCHRQAHGDRARKIDMRNPR